VAVRLLPPTAGQIIHRGQDVTTAHRAGLTAFRRDVQMVFQDTGSALNPRKTVRSVLDETFSLAGVPTDEKPAEALRLLELVGLGGAVLSRFPHQLSGGQRQRVGITRALAMRPRLLIADEPVSALDVSLQAQIVELLLDLRRRLGLAMLFITHDLALASQIADRVAVMFSGRIVEQGTPEEVLSRPLHPYTQALLASVPRGLFYSGSQRDSAADFIPEAETARAGCPYAPRCGRAISLCASINPDPTEYSAGRIVRCHLVASGAALA